jgi:dipeptidase E
MIKLFLTSTGLPPETAPYFLKLLEKDPKDTRVAFIPTAADPEEDKWFVDAARKELYGLKFLVEEVDLKESPEEIQKKLESVDVIYINGGNTFYLLDWTKKSGLDKYLGQLIENGKIYIGSSAGSILVGPNIELSGWDKSWDKNIVNLQDLSGLNLVPFAISSHFTEKDREILEKKSKELNYEVLPITDTQAVLVEGEDYKIVGKGEQIILRQKLDFAAKTNKL